MRKLTLIFVMCTSPWGQRTPDCDHSVVSQIPIDAGDLGYTPVDLIPPEESAMGALTVGPGVAIYGSRAESAATCSCCIPSTGTCNCWDFWRG
jgi:hypothetical protein